jgi:ATP-dependent RNA helicase DHX36
MATAMHRLSPAVRPLCRAQNALALLANLSTVPPGTAALRHCELHISARVQQQSGPASHPSDMDFIPDLSTISNSMALPKQQDYPAAPGILFELPSNIPPQFNASMESFCASKGHPMHAQHEYSKSKDSGYVCRLNLSVLGLSSETAHGRGPSKADARKAAWLHMLAKIHMSGALNTLCQQDATELGSRVVWRGKTKPSEKIEHDRPRICENVVPVILDQATLEAEKDAMVDIYNYAAGFGQVPRFEGSVIQARTSVTGRQRLRQLFKVTISLPDINLEACEIAEKFRHAEVAAAIAFKRAAEQRRLSVYGERADQNLPGFHRLNTDTAGHFFEVLREAAPKMTVQVKHEGGRNGHKVQLMINGRLIGEPVTMLQKKRAEDVAYLVAAVHLAKEAPNLLRSFEERLTQGKGKDKGIKEPPISDLEISDETLNIMQSALVKRKQAGLTDTRDSLGGVEEPSTGGVHHSPRQLSAIEADSRNSELSMQQQLIEGDPQLAELRAKRAALPINQHRNEVLKMLIQNPYSIIVGSTGSGKTTQVPQMILEHSISEGNAANCNIICTQPRRIAATSVARRVAAERDEPLQTTVGYHVRFDARRPGPGGITYCTTGILLEQLKHDHSVLDTASHIVIDEVHERDLNIDFLMAVLKRTLSARQAQGQSIPKVILMSATLDTELFAKYFAKAGADGEMRLAPSITVPGRLFPVKEHFLDSIMEELNVYGPALETILSSDKVSNDYIRDEMSFSQSRSQSVEDPQKSMENATIDWKRKMPAMTSEQDGDGESRENLVPTALVAATIAHICRTTDDGAVLTFLPGWDEIRRTHAFLREMEPFGIQFSDETKYQICLLHSQIPKEDQDLVFEPTPPGCRKIILSTNIAETSVTVADVKYVVDAGKLREKRYDQVKRISGLNCVWASRSNTKQRAGRAGRVSDGYYYGLFTKERQESLRAVGLPELLRTDLQETCLAIKRGFPTDSVGDFLAQAIEPPSQRAVEAAITSLKAIEALTEDEQLTALGLLLSKLPIHPSLGKMVVLGLIFKCLDPTLILGAAAEARSLSLGGIGGEAKARIIATRRSYAGEDLSDHMATLAAFREVAKISDKYGIDVAREKARDNYMHFGAFKAIYSTVKQMVSILTECGLISDLEAHPRPGEFGPPSFNLNSRNPALIKSLLLSGLHPNLGVKASPFLYGTPDGNSAIMHPSSLNFSKGPKGARRTEDKLRKGTLVTYSKLTKTDSTLFMNDTSVVHPLMAALFGRKLGTTYTRHRLKVDEWLSLHVHAPDSRQAASVILETRDALDRVLNGAFQSLAAINPENRTSTFLEDDSVSNDFVKSIVAALDRATGVCRMRNRWMTNCGMTNRSMGNCGYPLTPRI